MTEPTKIEQIKSNWLDRVIVVRNAVTNKAGEYDDEGYCDTKIPWGGSIYWLGVVDGNGERMCADCALGTILQQLLITGTIPEYKDNWFEDWNTMRKVKDG